VTLYSVREKSVVQGYAIGVRSLRTLLILIAIAAIAVASAIAGATGKLKLDVMGDIGAGAKNPAQIIAAGKQVGEVMPGATVDLPPGDYTVVLPIIGGHITRTGVTIEAGRTHTLLITDVAVLQVSAKDRTGKDPGFGVTVTDTNPPNGKLASFVTGDKVLFAPAQVDVKVDAPPQGYDWHAVALEPGHRALLSLDEVVPAELDVQTVLQKIPFNDKTRVVILRSGTQKQVASSDPGDVHRFKLDPGDYDVYVENRSGKGKPYVTVDGVHLDSGAKVERTVPLD
jgi:hypothetical protein